MIEGGDTNNSTITYLPPVPDRAPSRLRQHPERPALRVSAGGGIAAFIESAPGKPLAELLRDPLREMGESVNVPAEALARARWDNVVGKPAWEALPASERGALILRASDDLAGARALIPELMPDTIEVVVERDPDPDAAPDVVLFINGVQRAAHVVTVDPDHHWATADHEPEYTAAVEGLTPAAADRVTQSYQRTSSTDGSPEA